MFSFLLYQQNNDTIRSNCIALNDSIGYGIFETNSRFNNITINPIQLTFNEFEWLCKRDLSDLKVYIYLIAGVVIKLSLYLDLRQ